MKLNSIFICHILLTFSIRAQVYTCKFENNKTPYYYTINQDSTKNIWQIGNPNKSQFKYDTYYRKSFCTDTIQSLQPNDTFSFIVNFMRFMRQGFEISFNYKKYGDTGDFAKFEISVDTGKTWVDLVKEDTTYDMYWFTDKPNFKYNNVQWQSVDIDLSSWACNTSNDYLKDFFNSKLIQFRVTYITDSTQFAERDGMLIDNLMIADFHWNLKMKHYENPFSISPNPATNLIYFSQSKENSIQSITLYNFLGQPVYTDKSENITSVDISALETGIYMVILESNGITYRDQFIHINTY